MHRSTKDLSALNVDSRSTDANGSDALKERSGLRGLLLSAFEQQA